MMIPDDAVVVDHATAPLPLAYRDMGTSTIAEFENKNAIAGVSLKPIQESFA